ncbi:unnamed protein product, partial [Ixodes pacificus]
MAGKAAVYKRRNVAVREPTNPTSEIKLGGVALTQTRSNRVHTAGTARGIGDVWEIKLRTLGGGGEEDFPPFLNYVEISRMTVPGNVWGDIDVTGSGLCDSPVVLPLRWKAD